MWLLERARVEAGLAHVVSSRPSRTMVRNRHLADPACQTVGAAGSEPTTYAVPPDWAVLCVGGKVAMSRPDWAVLVSGKN